MNINELGAAHLMGEFGGSEVRRIDGDIFIELKDLVITDEDISFTTMGGYRIPVSVPVGQNVLSKLLADGGMFVVSLHPTYMKVTVS